MFPAILKNFSRFVMFALLILIVGCGGGDSDPAAPGGGGGGGGGGGDGDYEITLLTTGLGINSIWGSDKNAMWAVGERGLIMHNDGSGWRRMPTPSFHGLQAIWGIASDDIWAAGDVGTLLHYDGTAWSLVSGPNDGSLYTIWGTASDDIWAGGPGGTLIHFDGTDWSEVTSNTTRGIRGLIGASATEVWAACTNGILLTFDGTDWAESTVSVDGVVVDSHFYGIWYAPDNGALYLTGHDHFLLTRQASGEWDTSLANFNTINAIWGRSSTDFYTTDFRGSVYHWNGNGSVFTSTIAAANRPLFGLFGVASGETYAVGLEGGVFHSEAGTQSWDVDLRGNGWNMEAIWGTAGDNFEVIAGGAAFHYDGSRFLDYTVDVTTSYYDMWGASTGEAYAVGWGGVVALNGTNWASTWSGTSDYYYGISGLHSDFVVAVGDDGAVEARGPAGWQSLAPMGTEKLSAVWVADIDHTFVAGVGGAVHDLGTLEFSAGGSKVGRTSWDSGDTGVTADLVGIWGTSATNMYLISVEGDILHFDGTDFTPSLAVEFGDFSSIWGSAVDDIWAVGRSGLAYHYDGSEWAKIETGTDLWIHGVYGFGADEAYFVMDRGTAVKVARAGSS